MKTKYLDNEIELLNSIKRNHEISDYGQEKLNEFIAIKNQLTLTDVGSSLPFENSESKLCKTCNGNGVMWFKKKQITANLVVYGTLRILIIK